jgi:hypothetical protein
MALECADWVTGHPRRACIQREIEEKKHHIIEMNHGVSKAYGRFPESVEPAAWKSNVL